MNNETKIKDLTVGSVSKQLWLFSIPILFSNVFESLNGSINTIWVGRFLGENSLAATANANLIIFLVFSLVFGFGLASTTFIAQYCGRGEMENARKVFGASIGMIIIASIAASALGWWYCSTILKLLSTPIEAFADAYVFSRGIFIALPAIVVLLVVILSLRGIGDSLTAMWFMALTVVLDVVLNPLLILGIGIFPKLGIAGSAWATVVANYSALTLQIVYLYASRSPLCLRGAQLLYLLPSWYQIRRIFRQGFPICLQMLFLASSSLVMVSFVNKEGLDTIAAYNICQQLWMYLQMPGFAVSSAVGAMAAQNIGAGLWDRVALINRYGVIVCVVMSLALMAILIIFDRPIMQIFIAPGSAAIEIARHIQWLTDWSLILFGIATVIMATLRANGVVFLPLLFIFISVYPIRIGFYYCFYRVLGVDAIWLCFPVGALFCLIITQLYYSTGKWRNARLI